MTVCYSLAKSSVELYSYPIDRKLGRRVQKYFFKSVSTQAFLYFR